MQRRAISSTQPSRLAWRHWGCPFFSRRNALPCMRSAGTASPLPKQSSDIENMKAEHEWADNRQSCLRTLLKWAPEIYCDWIETICWLGKLSESTSFIIFWKNSQPKGHKGDLFICRILLLTTSWKSPNRREGTIISTQATPANFHLHKLSQGFSEPRLPNFQLIKGYAVIVMRIEESDWLLSELSTEVYIHEVA